MRRRNVVKRFLSNGEEVIIRYPRISDCNNLCRNINSLVRERVLIAIQKKQTRSQERKWLLQLLKDIKKGMKVALVVEINGRVVGLANVDKKQQDAVSHVGGFGISLVKEARGRGIGEKLLRTIIAEAKKILKLKIVILSAFANNYSAIHLYQKCGFVRTETMRGGIKYYGKFLDRIRMVKYL